MVVHNYIPTVMSSRSSAFSPKRLDFFAIHNVSIPGNIRRFFPLSRPTNLFPFARFSHILINSQQKAAYLARFVWYSLHK